MGETLSAEQNYSKVCITVCTVQADRFLKQMNVHSHKTLFKTYDHYHSILNDCLYLLLDVK